MRSTYHKFQSGYQSLTNPEHTPLNPRPDRTYQFSDASTTPQYTHNEPILANLRIDRHHRPPQLPRYIIEDGHSPLTNRWYPQTQEVSVYTCNNSQRTDQTFVNNFGQWSYQGYSGFKPHGEPCFNHGFPAEGLGPMASAQGPSPMTPPQGHGPMAPPQGGMMCYQWNNGVMDERMLQYKSPYQYYYQQMSLTSQGFTEQGTVIGNPTNKDNMIDVFNPISGNHGKQNSTESFDTMTTDKTPSTSLYKFSKPYKRQKSKQDKMTTTSLVLGASKRQRDAIVMRNYRNSNNMAPGAERSLKHGVKGAEKKETIGLQLRTVNSPNKTAQLPYPVCRKTPEITLIKNTATLVTPSIETSIVTTTYPVVTKATPIAPMATPIVTMANTHTTTNTLYKTQSTLPQLSIIKNLQHLTLPLTLTSRTPRQSLTPQATEAATSSIVDDPKTLCSLQQSTTPSPFGTPGSFGTPCTPGSFGPPGSYGYEWCEEYEYDLVDETSDDVEDPLQMNFDFELDIEQNTIEVESAI